MTERPTFPIPCSHCGKPCPDQHALWQHTKVKHGPKAARAVKPPPREDDEPSMADELVDAIQAAHAGKPVPEHLFVMFRDQFQRGTKVMDGQRVVNLLHALPPPTSRFRDRARPEGPHSCAEGR